MRALNDTEIQKEMKSCDFWSLEAGPQITRTWKFKDFKESMAFVNRVAQEAEAMNHHPDILVQYSRVKLTVNTHDVKGLSELDFRLAKFCNALSTSC
jgi:4a-hydroxytetrahydrobiopterin dehydratase